MTFRLLVLSYWFPPNNAIGASRAAAMARFFADRGWSVTVVGANSFAVPKDYNLDMTGIEVYRVTDTAITKFLNFKLGRKRWMRAISALIRYVAFPDAFRSTTKRMEHVVEGLIADGQCFDVILSTALPFSQHEVAGRLVSKTGALLVLDNRDTWACSAYRRRLPFSDARERHYEHRILSLGDILTVISEGMAGYYQDNYPDLADRLCTIRNGVDASITNSPASSSDARQSQRIVYTGILYGAKRDIRPVLKAARDSGLPIAFDFYGAEAEQIATLKTEFPMLEISDRGRVPRSEAVAAQRSADALLVGLGLDAAEKIFLPGKFFEYVGTGRPIIVIADPDYEISKLVDAHGLGIATRDSGALMSFLTRLASGEVVPRHSVPEPLTRHHQLGLLENRILIALQQPEQQPQT